MSDVSKLKFEKGTYNIKDSTARDEISAIQTQLQQVDNDFNSFKNMQPLIFDGYQSLEDTILEALATGRKIEVTEGVYEIFDNIEINCQGKTLWLEGLSKLRTQQSKGGARFLWRGEGVMLTLTNVSDLVLDNLEFVGSLNGEVPRVREGTTFFKIDSSIHATGCHFMYVDTISEWNGGYYHRTRDCFCCAFKTGFKNYSSNNLIFDRIVAQDFDTFLITNQGEGPINITNSSFERFISRVVVMQTQPRGFCNIQHSYFENSPNSTPTTGLTGDFTRGVVVSGGHSINFMDNFIMTKGIGTVIAANEYTRAIRSTGNFFSYAPVDTHTYAYILGHANLESVVCEDSCVEATYEVSGPHPTFVYTREIGNINPVLSRGYNPVTKVKLPNVT